MQYKSKSGEPVTEERWQWVAFYNDDTELCQFDANTGEYHYFAEIDHKKVVSFGMHHPQTGRLCKIEVPPKAKLIHFYNTIVQAPMGGVTTHHRLYAFGYELKKEKKINTILPNDFIVEADPDKIGIL